MKIAVLGCGPAGLLAAHAATRAGHEVDIFSKMEKSRLGGAQFLYIPVPGITAEQQDAAVTVYKNGSRMTYAVKVYGDAEAPTSWENFAHGMEYPIWNLQQAYDALWQCYSHAIVDTTISGKWLAQVGSLLDFYDHIISTVPRPALCVADGHHSFTSQKVGIVNHHKLLEGNDNWIEYSGRFGDPWYRCSLLFGQMSWEYNEKFNLGKDGFIVSKPLANDCDCWQEHERLGTIVFMGRYGQWQKGVLSHHAYEATQEMLAG